MDFNFKEQTLRVDLLPSGAYLVYPLYRRDISTQFENGLNSDRIIVNHLSKSYAPFRDIWMRKNERPAKNGWAPGNYIFKCFTCGENNIGGKRAVTCSNCAYKDREPTDPGHCLRCSQAMQVSKLRSAYLGRDNVWLGTCETCLTERPYGRTLIV